MWFRGRRPQIDIRPPSEVGPRAHLWLLFFFFFCCDNVRYQHSDVTHIEFPQSLLFVCESIAALACGASPPISKSVSCHSVELCCGFFLVPPTAVTGGLRIIREQWEDRLMSNHDDELCSSTHRLHPMSSTSRMGKKSHHTAKLKQLFNDYCPIDPAVD